MSQFANDVRYAWRSLAKTPGASLLMVGTLAIGLAANGIIFNFLDALVLRAFDFPNASRLVRVAETDLNLGGIDRDTVAPANLLDWEAQGRGGLAEMIAMGRWEANLRADAGAERVEAALVSPGFFEALGVRPAAGRAFTPDEAREGQDRRVILSDALWRRTFGGEPMVGRTVTFNGEPYDVVGIAPPKFQFPEGSEAWVPLVLPAPGEARRDQHSLSVIGRLAEGQSIGEAKAALGVIAKRLEAEYPQTNTGRGIEVMPFNIGFGDPVLPQVLAIWQAAAVLVMLIACVNVANLVLARGAERQRELALRMALGAARRHVVRQLFTEGVVMALGATALSIPLMALGARIARENMPAEILRYLPGWNNLGADWRTLAFSAALGLVAAGLFSAIPALRVTRASASDVLHEGGRASTAGRGRQRGRDALVVVQMAAALVLVATAGLAVRSSLALLNGPQGYEPEGLLGLDVGLSERAYPEPQQRLGFVRDVSARFAALPGVTGVTAANVLPARGSNNWRGVEIEGQPLAKDADPPNVDARWVEPSYFAVMRLPLLEGRAIEEGDDADAPRVAVVSRSFAQRFWPGQDALGKRFRTATREGDQPWLTVVGVCGDVIHHWVTRRNYSTMYVPMRQEPRTRLAFALRTTGDPDTLGPAARRALMDVDKDQPADDVLSMRRAIHRGTIGMQYIAGMMASFGVLALVLAVSGVYGLLSYRVSLRTVEIGVRMALGATRRNVLGLTVGQALRLAAVGLGAGVVLAFGMGRALSSALRGAVAWDPALLAAVTAALALASLAAAWVPARRAMRIDPAVALRSE
ncbi:MAG TPA: ABC transporter permease [Vicinamibacteria bacterium]|nr:ABC transporter permease [Vicinamibacteria bacterium]